MTRSEFSRFDEAEPWTPYVVISYRYNPSATIGKYIEDKTKIHTVRGRRAYTTLRQNNPRSSFDEYAKYIFNYQKMLSGVINTSKIKSIPDTFVIVVGITDKSILHENVADGGAIEYTKLFRLLALLGFDPLKPVRRRQKSLSDELGVEIRKVISAGHITKENLLVAVNKIGSRLKQEVQEYIYGGAKPHLAYETTHSFRPLKQSMYPSLYGGSSGINEPLYESGQLFEAIDFDVLAYQSDEMQAYAKQLVDEEKAIREETRGLVMLKNKTANEKRMRADARALRNAQIEQAATMLAKQRKKMTGRDYSVDLMKDIIETMPTRISAYKIIGAKNFPKHLTGKAKENMQKKILKFFGLTLKDYKKKLESDLKFIYKYTPVMQLYSKDSSLRSKILKGQYKAAIERAQEYERLLKAGKRGIIKPKGIGKTEQLKYEDKLTQSHYLQLIEEANYTTSVHGILEIAKSVRSQLNKASLSSDKSLKAFAATHGMTLGDMRMALFIEDFFNYYGYEP